LHCSVCFRCLSLPVRRSKTSGVEDEIKKQEQNWAQATLKEGAAAVDQYEADDIIDTDPTGRVTDKAQDKADLSSGDLKFQSMELSDLTVHVLRQHRRGGRNQHGERYLQRPGYKRQGSLH
jgi:hypothetical protein